MAILHSILGKLTGKVADSSFYEDRAGQNILRSLPGERRPGTEAQQRWEAEFAALLDAAWRLGDAVYVGFPAGRKYPALEKGFLKANARRAAEVEPIDPKHPFVRKKGAPKYFKARVDYARVLVADGALAVPEVEVSVEGESAAGGSAKTEEQGARGMVGGSAEQATRAGVEAMDAGRDAGVAAAGQERSTGEGAGREGQAAGVETGRQESEERERKRERVVRFAHRGTVRERWECFRGDRVYGAVAMPEADYCRVHLLGRRGETWEAEVRTEALPEGKPLYVYVFAVTEDGREVSPSVCRVFQ